MQSFLDVPQLGDVQQIPWSAGALLHGDEVVDGRNEESPLIDRYLDINAMVVKCSQGFEEAALHAIAAPSGRCEAGSGHGRAR